MKHGTYILTFFMALLSLSESGYAMVPFFTVASDTARQVVIYFEASETCVDSCYGSNNQVIAVLDSLLARNSDTKYITALNVITSVSPEDDESYNTNLISKRNHSVSEFLQRYHSNIDVNKIHYFSAGENWSELRKMAAADPNLPDREEVLILIDYHKNDIVKRKQLLRKLNQGAAYRYMVNNVFPKLRRSEITIVREIPEVTECYNISGDYDYLLKIHAPDMKYYQEFIINVLGTIESMGSLMSTFVMDEVKHEYGIPL